MPASEKGSLSVDRLKASLAELSARVAWLQAACDSTGDGLVTISERGAILSFNPAAEKIFGYRAEDVIEKNVSILMPPPDRERHDGYLARYLKTGEARIIGMEREVEGLRNDGSRIPLGIMVTELRLEGPRRFIGVVRDITERKRAEKELLLLQNLTWTIGSATDLESAIRGVLEKVCETTGWEHGEAWLPEKEGAALSLGPFWSRSPSALGEFLRVSRDRRFSPDEGLPGRAWASRRPEWIRDLGKADPRSFLRQEAARRAGLTGALAVPILADAEVVAVLAFFLRSSFEEDERFVRLVTAAVSPLGLLIRRRRAEQALRESEKRLNDVLDNAAAVVYLKDPEGRYLLVNRRFESLFNVRREQVVGMTDHDLFPREHADSFRANDRKVLAAKKPLEFEETAPQDDGVHTYISVKFPLFDSQGVVYGVCGISTDITERKSIEAELDRYRHRLEDIVEERTHELNDSYEQLRKAERMASIGELAAKIAHEIKNPLTGIYAAVQLLSRDVPAEDRKREIFDDVATEIRRLDETVQDLLRFARPVPPKPVEVDLKQFLRDVVDQLKKQPQVAKHKIRLLAEEGLVVSVDPKLMEQAVSNLVLNACQAVQRAGTVRVTAESSDGRVSIGVEDSGPGIPADVLPSIFEPFFTTKSKGTGLGLSIARKNVEAHGGTISVQSVLGKGTVFRIALPAGAVSGGR